MLGFDFKRPMGRKLTLRVLALGLIGPALVVPSAAMANGGSAHRLPIAKTPGHYD
jgi:hypothetical protein